MNFSNMTITKLHNMYKNKEVTVEEIVLKSLSKIDENKFNAYISSCSEDAIVQAKHLDENGVKNILDGIPCVIKDNINYKGYLNTCASKVLSNYKSIYNATVTSNLLNNNVVICGKANLDQFAMGAAGMTSYYGHTLNPLDVDRVPGGSSSGSAAAVASGDVLFALGTDTGGSVRQPASLCGVVGFRPTYGMISRYGVVSLNCSLDQVGIITNNVYDNALVYDILQGNDKNDGTSLNLDLDVLNNLEFDLKGKKIFIDTSGNDLMDESVLKSMDYVIKYLEENGAIVDKKQMKFTKHAPYIYLGIVASEVTSNLAMFDGIRYGFRSDDYDSLSELYSKTRGEGFGLEVKRRILIGADLLKDKNYSYYKELLQYRSLLANEIYSIYDEYDYMLTPMTLQSAQRFDEASMHNFGLSLYEEATALAGVPSISIPIGVDTKNNMPLGLHIVANKKEDAKVFAFAKYLEENMERGEF